MKKIKCGAIHVWIKRTEPSTAVTRMENLLSEDEQSRARSITDVTYRGEFIATRGFLREILGRYVGIEPEQLRFRYNLHGKPFLDKPKKSHLDNKIVRRIKFSLAHSHGLAILGFALDKDIGVDVEQIRDLPGGIPEDPKRHGPSNTKTVKLPRSVMGLAGLNKSSVSLRVWTLTEADLKARGTGFTSGNSFNRLRENILAETRVRHWGRFHKMSFRQPKEKRTGKSSNSRKDSGSEWYYCMLKPAPKFIAAVVVRGPRPSSLVVRKV